MANKKNGKSNETTEDETEYEYFTEISEVDALEFDGLVLRMKAIVEKFEGVGSDASLRGGCLDRALEVHGVSPGTKHGIDGIIETATKIYEFVSGGGKSAERSTGDVFTRATKP